MKLNLFKPKPYLKYKHLIPTNPTEEEFRNAWKVVFGDYPENCEVKNLEGFLSKCSKDNIGFSVMTPCGGMSHGGFGEHTEEPVLHDGQSYYYPDCGCSWGIDANGIRFHLIDRHTKLPVEFRQVKAIETINNYFNTNMTLVNKFINKNKDVEQN